MLRTPSVVRSWSISEIGRAQASTSAGSLALLSALGAALPACGGKEPSGAPTTVVGTGPLLPFDGRDEVLLPDFTWREDYEETKIPLAGGVTTTATQGDRWYLRGVGKLKETGTQTEELVSYSLK